MIAAAVLGIGIALSILGCEKRVVAVHNPYLGSEVHIQPAAPAVHERGFLDNLWDALFGWTKPAPSTNVIGTQPSMFRPTTVQSSP